LYFRSALFFSLRKLCRERGWLALALQAILFGLWHARAFRVAPIAPALGVLLLTTAAGLLWGLHARRDRTVLYTAAQHTLFLIVQ
jgi:membrane protease YdiL (CAAX protease family)